MPGDQNVRAQLRNMSPPTIEQQGADLFFRACAAVRHDRLLDTNRRSGNKQLPQQLHVRLNVVVLTQKHTDGCDSNRLIRAGVTTIQEVLRVSRDTQEAHGGPEQEA